MDLSGLPAALRGHVGSFSWKQLLGVVSAGLVGKILWNHYGILRHRRLVPHDLGPPLIGHTLLWCADGLPWAQSRYESTPHDRLGVQRSLLVASFDFRASWGK
eukprot:TRINITY_DN21249_c0_g3_i1.p2 TRINITY_DN21249_c0_g3~~TRINITY_DN21249_c0_g3_i1.p2  ORF type:complete len:103 (+),score=3.15 TRINITY_DN21249_c0_g3_i1:124-432(+)